MMLKPCFSYLVKSWWSGCICWFSSLETTGVCTNCSPCSGCFGSWESQWFCGHEPGTAESTHTSRLICGFLFWAVDANGAQISGSFGSPVAPAEPSCLKWTLFVCSCSIGRGASEAELCHCWASRLQPRNQSQCMKEISVDTQQDYLKHGQEEAT